MNNTDLTNIIFLNNHKKRFMKKSFMKKSFMKKPYSNELIGLCGKELFIDITNNV